MSSELRISGVTPDPQNSSQNFFGQSENQEEKHKERHLNEEEQDSFVRSDLVNSSEEKIREAKNINFLAVFKKLWASISKTF